ncbi:MAGE family-domain-containing protein [Crepidotus variabilis]|uniref:MAGE family-domain-containing protein n=1 Tax=Crepidotus variabilis TaxID=179855 RepID=A0A9P6EKX5_9AGAR|nr:MAGE family-domain-containing protein [Crepidotus variabilis]
MARRNAARAGPSQTQPQTQRPTQTQRRGGRSQPQTQHQDEDEDDDQEEEGGGNEDMEEEGENAIVAKANDLVRLALFVEQRRTILRRDEINKKVLGQAARAFNRVFLFAQQKLRDAFGMELVELPSRAGLEADAAPDGESSQARPTTGLKKRAAAQGSKAYMVRSCLHPLIIEHAAQTYPEILEEEGGDQGTLFPMTLDDDADDDDDGEVPPKFYGSLLSWTRSDQLGSIGILYVILALVLVNGRVMPDNELRQHLKTLRLPSLPNALPIKLNTTSTVRSMNLDTFLSHILRQGYLDRQQVGGDAALKGKKGAGTKRLRTQAEDIEEGRSYEWRWGPRAHCEVGEENIAKFIAEFMVESDDIDEGAAGAAAARRKREDTLKKMYAGIEKASGGKLAELKAA